MATLDITITSATDVYGYSNKTISGADLTRLINAYKTKFGTTDNASTGQAWANQLIQLMKQTVHDVEEQTAVATARAGVSDIGIT